MGFAVPDEDTPSCRQLTSGSPGCRLPRDLSYSLEELIE